MNYPKGTQLEVERISSKVDYGKDMFLAMRAYFKLQIEED